MKKQDEIIKKSLQSHMGRIDDDSFAERIIEMHLRNKQNIEYRPFVNFTSLIIGVSSIIVSIGLILLIWDNASVFDTIRLNVNHGIIMLSVSFIFLIYKWLENLLQPTKCI